jgi:hypothetical protein
MKKCSSLFRIKICLDLFKKFKNNTSWMLKVKIMLRVN